MDAEAKISLKMELHAAGFNAWNQLIFDDAQDDEPDDLLTWQVVLKDDFIDRPRAFLSYTADHVSLQGAEKREYLTFVETASGVVACEGSVWTTRAARTDHREGHDGNVNMHQYSSAAGLLARKEAETFVGLGDIIQLVAYATGFAALSSDGMLWTWGDERYLACLGRDVDESPAEAPGLVSDLQDLPTGQVVKVVAGGYLLAALTLGNDLYCWGGHPAGNPVLEGLSDRPNPVVIMGHDIVDIGVGDAHLIALTSDGRVFVVGDNTSGQLGLDLESTRTWQQVKLAQGNCQVVTSVAAGPRSSFIVVRTGIKQV